jgi:hypothetical protein
MNDWTEQNYGEELRPPAKEGEGRKSECGEFINQNTCSLRPQPDRKRQCGGRLKLQAPAKLILLEEGTCSSVR